MDGLKGFLSKVQQPSAERLREENAHKNALLELASSLIKDLQINYCGSDGHMAVVGKRDPSLLQLCDTLDAIFRHGLKKKRDYWEYVSQFVQKDDLVMLGSLVYVKTDSGRCRAWLRHALNEGMIESYLDSFGSDTHTRASFYEPYAFLMDRERFLILQTLMSGAARLTFRIPFDDADLDARGLQTLQLPPSTGPVSAPSSIPVSAPHSPQPPRAELAAEAAGAETSAGSAPTAQAPPPAQPPPTPPAPAAEEGALGVFASRFARALSQATESIKGKIDAIGESKPAAEAIALQPKENAGTETPPAPADDTPVAALSADLVVSGSPAPHQHDDAALVYSHTARRKKKASVSEGSKGGTSRRRVKSATRIADGSALAQTAGTTGDASHESLSVDAVSRPIPETPEDAPDTLSVSSSSAADAPPVPVPAADAGVTHKEAGTDGDVRAIRTGSGSEAAVARTAPVLQTTPAPPSVVNTLRIPEGQSMAAADDTAIAAVVLPPASDDASLSVPVSTRKDGRRGSAGMLEKSPSGGRKKKPKAQQPAGLATSPPAIEPAPLEPATDAAEDMSRTSSNASAQIASEQTGGRTDGEMGCGDWEARSTATKDVRTRRTSSGYEEEDADAVYARYMMRAKENMLTSVQDIRFSDLSAVSSTRTSANSEATLSVAESTVPLDAVPEAPTPGATVGVVPVDTSLQLTLAVHVLTGDRERILRLVKVRRPSMVAYRERTAHVCVSSDAVYVLSRASDPAVRFRVDSRHVIKSIRNVEVGLHWQSLTLTFADGAAEVLLTKDRACGRSLLDGIILAATMNKHGPVFDMEDHTRCAAIDAFLPTVEPGLGEQAAVGEFLMYAIVHWHTDAIADAGPAAPPTTQQQQGGAGGEKRARGQTFVAQPEEQESGGGLFRFRSFSHQSQPAPAKPVPLAHAHTRLDSLSERDHLESPPSAASMDSTTASDTTQERLLSTMLKPISSLASLVSHTDLLDTDEDADEWERLDVEVSKRKDSGERGRAVSEGKEVGPHARADELEFALMSLRVRGHPPAPPTPVPLFQWMAAATADDHGHVQGVPEAVLSGRLNYKGHYYKITAWKPNFFALRGGSLLHFRSEHETTPKQRARLAGTRCLTRRVMDHDHPYAFDVIVSGKVFSLAAPSYAEQQLWLRAINLIAAHPLQDGARCLHAVVDAVLLTTDGRAAEVQVRLFLLSDMLIVVDNDEFPGEVLSVLPLRSAATAERKNCPCELTLAAPAATVVLQMASVAERNEWLVRLSSAIRASNAAPCAHDPQPNWFDPSAALDLLGLPLQIIEKPLTFIGGIVLKPILAVAGGGEVVQPPPPPIGRGYMACSLIMTTRCIHVVLEDHSTHVFTHVSSRTIGSLSSLWKVRDLPTYCHVEFREALPEKDWHLSFASAEEMERVSGKIAETYRSHTGRELTVYMD